MEPVTIIGTPVSPFVRKVLVCLDLKRVPYQVDPIVAFFTGDAFEEVSPLRLIPVLMHGDVMLTDSSVICEYIDEAFPGYSLLPSDPADRARARWLDEYADTRLAAVLLWKLFNEATVNPSVWGQKRDVRALLRIVKEDVPPLMDYLESQLPQDSFLFGELGLADISIAAQFRNAGWARFAPDAYRWPNVAGFVERVLSHPVVAALAPLENAMMTTPIADQRAVAASHGLALTETTFMESTVAKPGPMTTRRAGNASS